jgi:hypothetical protein
VPRSRIGDRVGRCHRPVREPHVTEGLDRAASVRRTTADQSAVAIVDFSAAARTRQSGEVLLPVERAGALSGPGGAADVETSLTVSIRGDGGPAGALDLSAPIVAGRWVGSGKRMGQLAFSLRSTVPGVYSVPVRFVLSAP